MWEKNSKIIESNQKPNAKSTTKSCPQSATSCPQNPYIFKIPSGTVTPLPHWAACATNLSEKGFFLIFNLNLLLCNLRPFPFHFHEKGKDCQQLSGSELCANTLHMFVGDLTASHIPFSCCFINALMVWCMIKCTFFFATFHETHQLLISCLPSAEEMTASLSK